MLWLVCGAGAEAGWKEANPRVVRFDVAEEVKQDWEGEGSCLRPESRLH